MLRQKVDIFKELDRKEANLLKDLDSNEIQQKCL